MIGLNFSLISAKRCGYFTGISNPVMVNSVLSDSYNILLLRRLYGNYAQFMCVRSCCPITGLDMPLGLKEVEALKIGK